MKHTITLAILLSTIPSVLRADGGDDDDDDDEDAPRATSLVPEAALPAYREECGGCHLAYPPGMLPARSWQRLLAGLDDHFGQNAEVATSTRAAIGAWLGAHAAESGSHPLSPRVLRSAGASTPLRISDLHFIRHEHEELAPGVFSKPSVKSVANCGACHRGAERWVFDEHSVRIPR